MYRVSFSGSRWRKGLLPVGLQLRGTDYISGHQGTDTHIPETFLFRLWSVLTNQCGRHSSDNVSSFSNIAVCPHHDSQGLEGGMSDAVWARYVNAAACKSVPIKQSQSWSNVSLSSGSTVCWSWNIFPRPFLWPGRSTRGQLRLWSVSVMHVPVTSLARLMKALVCMICFHT